MLLIFPVSKYVILKSRDNSLKSKNSRSFLVKKYLANFNLACCQTLTPIVLAKNLIPDFFKKRQDNFTDRKLSPTVEAQISPTISILCFYSLF